MNELFLLGGMAIVTFGIRYPAYAVSERLEFSTHLVRFLRYVPPAILAAIVVPSILIPTGNSVNFSYTNARLVSAIITLGFGWFSQNLLLTIVLGMLSFLSWRWFLSTLLSS